MKKVVLHIALLFLIAGSVSAQQEPNFTQYMFNPLKYNAAYAGNQAILRGALVYRNQWVGIEGAPKITTFSLHSPVGENHKNMGVGFEITSDQVGPVKNVRIDGSYAYRFKINKIDKGTLGFGLKAGIIRASYDWNMISYKDENDVLVGTDQAAKTQPIFDAGAYYARPKQMFIGLSLQNLNNPKITPGAAAGATTGRQYLNMTFTYGKVWELNDRVVFRPSILMQSTIKSQVLPLADINMSFQFDRKYWIGASYRTSKAIAVIFEMDVKDMFRFGYSYDYYLSQLSINGTGSHEIYIGINYNVFSSRMRSPRYYF